MELRYTMKQNRQLYQLFPDKQGNMRYAVPIPSRHSIDDPKEMYDRYCEYFDNGWIDYIGNLLDDGITYIEIRESLDL